MDNMRVRTRWPAQAARKGDDWRTTVTFEDASLSVPLRIHFAWIRDDETGEQELRLVGVELGDTPRSEEAAVALPELTALTLRNVTERFPRWLDLARAHATPTLESQSRTGELAASVKRWKPGRLNPDFLRMIAGEYRRHVDEGDPAPISTIARSHEVTPSAASRWVKRAREGGYLDAS